jgi:hypothetical protein
VLLVVEVVVEVVGVNGGGGAVAEHEAMTRQIAGATRATLFLDMRRPLGTLTGKTPVKFV